MEKLLLKPLDTFGTKTKIKAHRFTNNLQGLQKVHDGEKTSLEIFIHEMLYFLRKHENSINSRYPEFWSYFLNTCHDTAKRA